MRQSNSPFTRLACLVILTVFVFSGCRSGIFKKSETEWKRPDISGLAFWNKGDAKSVPPPPAHHFNPAPASGDMKTAGTISTESIKAAAKFKSANAEPELQNKFNQLVDAAKKEKGSAAGAVAEISELNAESKDKPIRSPYSLSDTKDSIASATSSSIKNAENTFDPVGLKTQVSAVDTTIEKAQSDFKAALANSNQSIKNSVSASSAAASELAKIETNDFKNDFQLPKNDFQLPKKIEATQNKIASAQNQFIASAQEVNHSLYDATGKLTSGVKDASKKTIDNLLKPSSAAMAVDSRNAFDQSLPQAKQIAADAVATASDNSLSESDDELKKVRSEVQMAQQQIADLREQIAAAKQNAAAQQNASVQNGIPPAARASVNLNVPNAALNMAAQAVSQPMERVAQVNFNRSHSTTGEGNFSPLQSSSSNSSTTNSASPANNLLRSGSQFAAGSDEKNSFATSATPSQGYHSDFQSPIRGDYAAQTVGGNSNANSSTSPFDVQAVGLQSPISQSSAFNHVSEIDIPPAVLQGSGSYAPGSVNRLLPNK